MMRYSIQPKNGIFVKGYGFLSFAKNMSKNIGKSFSSKYSPGMLAMRQELLDHAKKSKTDALKTSSKRVIQKQQKQLVIWLVIELLLKLEKFQKIHSKIIQRQLRMIKKFLKRNIYLQMKDKKILMKYDIIIV